MQNNKFNRVNNILNTNTMSEKVKSAPLDLGLLEEDDEFEEFPAEGMIYSFNLNLL